MILAMIKKSIASLTNRPARTNRAQLIADQYVQDLRVSHMLNTDKDR